MKNDLKRLLVKSSSRRRPTAPRSWPISARTMAGRLYSSSSSSSNWFVELRNVWRDGNESMGRSLILGQTAFEDEDDDEYEDEGRS